MSDSSFSLDFYRPDQTNYPSWASEFQNQLNQTYLNLPWPKQIEKIALYTKVVGGKGDISAAGKVINLLSERNPKIKFEWFLYKKPNDPTNPTQFLDDSKKTEIDPPKNKADLLITGPVYHSWNDYDFKKSQKNFDFSETSSQFSFIENGAEAYGHKYGEAKSICQDLKDEGIEETIDKTYAKIHSLLFPSVRFGTNGLPMGLKKGTGIFLDPIRIKEARQFEVSSRTYLDELEDKALKENVTKILNDNLSVNSGYVHHLRSWQRFVDFVAAHEKKKDVLIILNQSSYENLSTKDFANALFTPERLAFLKDLGYGKVIFKGEEETSSVNDNSSEGLRTLTVISCKNILPKDMLKIQLASERIAATGDNTVGEAFASKCKMYFYENVFNGIFYHKQNFLNEQVALASEINPRLGRFIELEAKAAPLTPEERQEALKIIDDPELDQWTLQLCKKVTDGYSFDNIFLAALKRHLWHQIMPSLVDVELSAIDEHFKQATVEFLTFRKEPRKVKVKNLNILTKKLMDAIAPLNL